MNLLPSTRPPGIFVGSSTEGLPVAQIVHAQLNTEFRSYLWTQGLFAPSTYTIETLEQEVKARHFAVIVGTPDDAMLKRGASFSAIRDNLVFELGMFMGVLGRRHTFLVVPKGIESGLPSDLMGLSSIQYDAARFFSDGYQDQISAMSGPCLELRQAIAQVWGRDVIESERRLRAAMSSARLKSLRRLHDLITDLRDLLIIFPGKLMDALADRDQFGEVKAQMAQKVENSSKTFLDDPELADLRKEIAELVAYTRTAVLSFPYPEEVLATRAEANETLKVFLQKYASQIISGAPLLKTLEDDIEDEMNRRATRLAERYEKWWKNSHESIQSATTRLKDAMFTASLTTGDKLLAEHGLS